MTNVPAIIRTLERALRIRDSATDPDELEIAEACVDDMVEQIAHQDDYQGASYDPH